MEIIDELIAKHGKQRLREIGQGKIAQSVKTGKYQLSVDINPLYAGTIVVPPLAKPFQG